MKISKMHSESQNTPMSAKIRYAAAFFVPLCFFALFLSCLTLSFLNDLLGFVRPYATAEITLEHPELSELADTLEEHGIILNPRIFALFAQNRGAQELVASFSGNVTLDSSMSYSEIIAALK